MLEPLAVGVHACKRAGVCIGSTVLVLGAGPIGLVTLITAKAFGASKVVVAGMTEHHESPYRLFRPCIVDLVKSRLSVATSMGADKTIIIQPCETDQAIVEKVVAALGCEPTVSLDCSGAEQSVRVAIQVSTINKQLYISCFDLKIGT